MIIFCCSLERSVSVDLLWYQDLLIFKGLERLTTEDTEVTKRKDKPYILLS